MIRWHLAKIWPDAPLIVSDDPGERFNRGRALAAGIERLPEECKILVLVDGDLWVPEKQLWRAVKAAEKGCLAIPFDRVENLTKDQTSLVRTGKCPINRVWPTDDLKGFRTAPCAGGLNILLRENYHRAGGFDTRFSGWGFEDAAFVIAYKTLVGEVVRCKGRAIHLWHPTVRNPKDEHFLTGRKHRKRYSRADGIPEAMAELVEGNRC